MRILSLLSVCALAWLANACERHPLVGDPPPGEKHAAHSPAHPAEGGADLSHVKPAPPATPTPSPAVKSEEAPKFFPEKK